MRKHHATLTRRRFIVYTAGSAALIPLAARVGIRPASGAEIPKLDPASQRAQQLSYTPDAESSDNPARQDGAHCANCTHFHGEEGDQWASCNIFPEHRVNANGWCASWYSKG